MAAPPSVAGFDPVPDRLPLGRRSVSWKVLAEPVAFLGGGRALLLQVAHPKVGAGVEQHSTYATDPWARLARTVDVMAKLAFGTPEASARQSRLLERMHRRVVGTTDEGEAYSALDPDLLVWVWATLVDTGLVLYERVFPPLTDAEREQYYQESTLVAAACGVPEGARPATWDGLQALMARQVDEVLRATPAARAVAHATMVPPLPWPVGVLASGPLRLITAGTFPAALRAGFGFGWDARRQRRLDRLFLVARLGVRALPAGVRQAGFAYAVRSEGPIRVPWLQRRGAAITARRMAAFHAEE